MADNDPAATELRAQADRLLQSVSQHLPHALSRVNFSSRSIPSDEDFHFYSNFREFRDPILGIQSRVEALLSQISSLSIIPRAPAWSSDPDESYEWLVGIQDEILERVDSSFDEFKKGRTKLGLADDDGFQKVTRKRRREGKQTQPLKEESVKGNVRMAVKDGKRTERCPVPFHIWSIPRPQDKFDAPVDNSDTPFKHPKQLSEGPLEPTQFNLEESCVFNKLTAELAESKEETCSGPEAQDGGTQVVGTRESLHPLEGELRRMDFVDSWLLDTLEPKKPESLSKTPITFVDSPAALKGLAAKLLAEREIAVDLENHQYRSFQGFTCLMQISTRSEDFIVDTLELRSLIGPYFQKIFASPSILKVMHGADSDIMWLQRDFGIYVCNLFDTGQASRVLEMKSHGLSYLLEHFCGVNPDKRYQLADWRLRPLSAEMLKYAREDTHYLLYVHDMMKQMLVSARCHDLESQDPLLEVYKRSRDICLKLYEKENFTEESYLQVYGLHEKQFQAEQLAVLAGLYAWRDQVARTEDESTGYVLPNHLLLKLAEEMPDSAKKLRSMLSSRHTLVARNAAAILDLIRESRKKALLSTKKEAYELRLEGEKNKCVLDPSLSETFICESNVERGTDVGMQEDATTRKVETAVTGDWISDDVVTSRIAHEGGMCPTFAENLSDGIKDNVLPEGSKKESLPQKAVGFLPREKDIQDGCLPVAKHLETVVGKESVLDDGASRHSCELTSDSTGAHAKTNKSQVVLRRASTSSLFGKRVEKNPVNGKLESSSLHDAISSSRDVEITKLEPDECDPSVENQKTPLGEREVKLDAVDAYQQGTASNRVSSCVTPTEQTKVLEAAVPLGITTDIMVESPHSQKNSSLCEVTGSNEKSTSSVVRMAKRPSGGLASMLGMARFRQIEVKGYTTSSEDPEQVEARLKAERIRASVALPFHTFDGVDRVAPNEATRRGHEATCKPEENLQKVKTCQDQNMYEDPGPFSGDMGDSVQLEDVISLETNICATDQDSERGKTADSLGGLLLNGLITSATGTKHRGWWPCLVNSSQQSSVDNVGEETTDAEEAGHVDSELPLSISEKYRHPHRRRREWHGSSASASLSNSRNMLSTGKSGFDKAGLNWSESNPEPQMKEKRNSSSMHRGGEEFDSGQFQERGILPKPYDFSAARKSMGFFGDFRDTNNKIDAPDSIRPRLVKKDKGDKYTKGNETAFDPLRRMREFKPEGIEPAKRRQVFPQTGNRTGVFK